MKILIVDDKEEDLYLLKTLLEGNGYEVASAVNGVEALGKLRVDGIDMIISDILMPKMDGFRLCREVKKDRKLKKIAMVFYTATYTDPSDEEFALRLGVEKFIVKPTEPDVLMELIKEVIKNHEMGTLMAPRQPIKDETVYLTEYNERLIRKMENKMLELKRVNMVLGDSEEKYKDLIDNANDAVLVVDQDGHIGFVNPKFCEMTGYSVDEAKLLHINKLVHPDDVGMVREYLSKRMAGERVPRNYELRLLTRTGQTIYLENNAGIIEKEGRLIEVLNIMRDITQRREAEESLRVTSEKRKELEDIINHSPAVIFLWRTDEGWPVEFVSDNVRQFGYTPEDFYSGRILFLNIVHPDDLERVAAKVGKFSQEGCKDLNQEYRIITKSGEVCWIEDRTWVRRDVNSVITHYQGIILDITKRKQAEEEILMLAHTIRNINVCISITDMDNNIISVNKAFCDVYGYKEEEILGKNTSILWSSLAPEDLTREILPQTLKGGWQGEFYNKRKDGSDFPIYLSTSVIGDENGKPIAMVGVSRDITKQKLAQE